MSPARIQVRVTPRSSRNEVTGYTDGLLSVRLHAPPVEGEANKALVKLLADVFGVHQRDVSITRGDASRNKTVAIEGLSQEQVADLLSKCSPRRQEEG